GVHVVRIAAARISKHHGSQLVLDNVSVELHSTSRLGIVGRNGAGKSTLLRILAGLEAPDSGGLTRDPRSLEVGLLAQEHDALPRETVRNYLWRRTGLGPVAARMDALEDRIQGDLTAIEPLTETVERFRALGGGNIEARAAEVCDSLRLPADPDFEMSVLSGGQRARAALASMLLARFDVFLLDEPTNDLDFEGLARLEDWIGGLKGGVAVVSHDRHFLDRIVNDILELDEHSHTATAFAGGFSAYREAAALGRAQQRRGHDRFVSERARLQQRIRRQRSWAEKGVRRARNSDEPDKNIRFGKSQGAQNLASKASSLERRLDQLETVEKPWEGWNLDLDIAPGRRSGDIVVRLEGAVLTRGTWKLGSLDLEITYGERIALMGPNGSGKTTLLKAILGQVPLARGRRYVGPGVVVGILDQRRALFGDGVMLSQFQDRSGLLEESARRLLAKFDLYSEHVERSVDSLSPGERTRAGLALLAAAEANCLLLDEPTNQLDIPAIEELERALASYPGTLVVVSHDRSFLDNIGLEREIALPVPENS
ncbi:MAG: ABC-F family ATP-binding cassette domain-containing protein, partial [Actinomycetota bacterium]